MLRNNVLEGLAFTVLCRTPCRKELSILRGAFNGDAGFDVDPWLRTHFRNPNNSVQTISNAEHGKNPSKTKALECFGIFR